MRDKWGTCDRENRLVMAQEQHNQMESFNKNKQRVQWMHYNWSIVHGQDKDPKQDEMSNKKLHVCQRNLFFVKRTSS
jgi:hypothetical protein